MHQIVGASIEHILSLHADVLPRERREHRANTESCGSQVANDEGSRQSWTQELHAKDEGERD